MYHRVSILSAKRFASIRPKGPACGPRSLAPRVNVRGPKAIDGRRFLCSAGCGLRFDTETNVTKHVAMNHRDQDPIPCRVLCGFEARDNCFLYLHELDHYRDGRVECPEGCETTTKNVGTMVGHMNQVHFRVGRVICTVKGCGADLQSQTALDYHMRYVHGDRSKAPTYDQFIERIHLPGPRPRLFADFVCSVGCGLAFETEEQMLEHVDVNRRDQDPIPCRLECGYEAGEHCCYGAASERDASEGRSGFLHCYWM